jgi:NAD(P)-dependent dehydrogenase (short-subunit alcohol dehydrogenase family)
MAAPHVDMRGRHVMITGATAGIGEAAARALAKMGADLTIVCRNREKGEATLADLHRIDPDIRLDMRVGDLGVQADVRRIADEVLATDRPLHVLFNNAGVVQMGRSETVDGIETTFAVNHLAVFLLTNLLLPRLRASAPSRVVCTSSDAHRFASGGLDFDDLQSEQGYTTFGAYGRSKLCNILFTSELGRREHEVGTGVTTYAYHPGFVGSDFAKNNGVLARVVMGALAPFARSPRKGAETGVYLCTSPDVAHQSGRYYFNRKLYKPAQLSRIPGASERLWKESEALCRLA